MVDGEIIIVGCLPASESSHRGARPRRSSSSPPPCTGRHRRPTTPHLSPNAPPAAPRCASARHRTPAGGRLPRRSAARCVCSDSAPYAGTRPHSRRMCRRPAVVEGEVGRGAVTFDERAAGAVAGLAAGVVFPGRRGSGEVGRPRA